MFQQRLRFCKQVGLIEVSVALEDVVGDRRWEPRSGSWDATQTPSAAGANATAWIRRNMGKAVTAGTTPSRAASAGVWLGIWMTLDNTGARSSHCRQSRLTRQQGLSTQCNRQRVAARTHRPPTASRRQCRLGRLASAEPPKVLWDSAHELPGVGLWRGAARARPDLVEAGDRLVVELDLKGAKGAVELLDRARTDDGRRDGRLMQ